MKLVGTREKWIDLREKQLRELIFIKTLVSLLTGNVVSLGYVSNRDKIGTLPLT